MIANSSRSISISSPSPSEVVDRPSPSFSSTAESTFGTNSAYRALKLDLEPNPFEQSFASKDGTPNSSQKALLPPVASLASPSPLLGPSTNTGFNWGINSLRSGPLSPAMLPGPSQSALAFVDSHLRSGLTPNESNIRTGLTPGGSGSIFPAPSPTAAAIFGLAPPTPSGLQSSSFPQTPLPIDSSPVVSQGSSMSAPLMTATAVTSSTSAPVNHASSPVFQPQIISQSAMAAQSHPQGKEPFADSASAAANGLYLLSQGQQQQRQADAAKASEMQAAAEARSGDKKKGAAGRKNSRKAEDVAPVSNKRQRSAAQPRQRSDSESGSPKMEDYEEVEHDSNGRKLTEEEKKEEKKKNFLERNRIAALKCRQRKKQWLNNLQAKVEYYGNENEALNAQVAALREQVVSLKALLLTHKDCSASRALPPGQDPISNALGNQDFVQSLDIAQQTAIGQGMGNQNLGSRRFV